VLAVYYFPKTQKLPSGAHLGTLSVIGPGLAEDVVVVAVVLALVA
jgi:hypothetical protein